MPRRMVNNSGKSSPLVETSESTLKCNMGTVLEGLFTEHE